jgi:tetratricopeptide (TPR) repeat protein
LAEIVHLQGDISDAERRYQEALSLFREVGEKRGAAFALYQLGRVDLERNDTIRASENFSESLALRQDAGERATIIDSLEGLADVAYKRGDLARAVRLFAATEALRISLGILISSAYGEERNLILTTARSSLGESGYAREWARGQSQSIDEAIVEALNVNLPYERAAVTIESRSSAS